MSQPPQTTAPWHQAAGPPPQGFGQRYATLIALVLVGAATTGYFLGLTSPMNATSHPSRLATAALTSGRHESSHSPVAPATPYREMAKLTGQIRAKRTAANRAKSHRASKLPTLQGVPYDLDSPVVVDEAEKIVSLAHRATRRAFNGAPPTIPHPAEQLNSASCMACHGEGLRSKSLRASKMPHPYYANCTQCHVEQQAKFAIASATFENSFVGVPAPTRGGRAYRGAPPTIPHSTWMRNDCGSCHGRSAAPGMESTHPWRHNCLQCHGESSQLNQTQLKHPAEFLPAPAVRESYE